MTEIVSEGVAYLDALEAIESVSYSTMAKVIDARAEAVELSRKAAEAIGPTPDYDDYDDISQWVADLMIWLTNCTQPRRRRNSPRIPFLAARTAMTTPITLLTTRARRSLISPSLKVRGGPITGPGWTEVDSEKWSNEYKHKQRMDKAAQN